MYDLETRESIFIKMINIGAVVFNTSMTEIRKYV